MTSGKSYVDRLVNQAAEAIAQANSRLEPARLGWGSVPVPDELFNRRTCVRVRFRRLPMAIQPTSCG
ncbi:MAG: hypothetical protein R2762_01015 [Bryobacteraceae bacterium]